MSDLLPCPFCGGTNLGLLRHVRYFPHGVICRHCYASATSVERWNTRALPAVQPERQSNNPSIRESDTAPAGLSAGGGAGWQPIETAPKDRVVDLWSSKGFRYPDALWDVCWGEKCWTNPHNHVSIEEGGPYTHWRYPPEPPATEGI